jgi:hypothetical protein
MARDSTDKLIALLKKNVGAGVRERPTPRGGRYLAFASKREEQVFRAVASVSPKPVLIRDAEWHAPAERHTQSSLKSCAIRSDGSTYRLTESGKRRAVREKLLKD